MKFLFACLALSVALAGCGKDSNPYDMSHDTHSESNSQSFKYHMSENGCDTGEHEFNSKEALCKGLQDDALNHGCATTMRVQYFQDQGCN